MSAELLIEAFGIANPYHIIRKPFKFEWVSGARINTLYGEIVGLDCSDTGEMLVHVSVGTFGGIPLDHLRFYNKEWAAVPRIGSRYKRLVEKVFRGTFTLLR